MTADVKVFQHGMSQRHTARCECGWQTSVGSMKAAQNLAAEHRSAGCPGPTPSMEMVPAAPATVEPSSPWNGEQLEILKRDLGIRNDDHLAYFAQVATHKGLDPFLGEIVPVYYGGDMVIQETVEGLRTIAERSGLYDGYDGPYWCGPDLAWKPVWLADEPPAAARYFVRRKDWAEPASGVARWKSSVQLDRHGKPQPIWRDRPDEMLGKTAEVRALKRAFPKEFARAGIAVRDLSDAQVVTLEARRAGLNDDDRHALVSDVTGGRTESTRDLTDDEVYEARAEVARRADPQTGEVEEPDAVARTIARAAGDLEGRMERLTPSQTTQIKTWRRAQGLTRPLFTMPAADRNRIAAELDRRDQEGWNTPPEPAEEPSDEDDVVPGDVVEPDLFDDTEPF
jgi:phage recombination protein Bet